MCKRVACVMLLVGFLVVPAVGYEAPTWVRSFDRFEFDAVTAHGLWAEAATADAHQDNSGISSEAITVEPRLVYGGSLAEGGIFIPYHWLHSEFSGFFGTASNDENGIGDVRLYGKLLPVQTEWVDAGLGLDLSFPTGDDSKGFGTGEVGFLPFGAAAVHLGLADLRAHFGYQTYTGSNPIFLNFQRVERAPDSFVYGGGVFSAITPNVGLRAELVGQAVDSADDNRHILAFEPGVDLRFPLGQLDLLLRPTGAVGLTSDSLDWGIGGSVVLAWNPDRSAP